ncbi:MAG TPA: hypothetical protein VI382_09955 [Candidatus Manganitrophaceae bacterium]|nr:hypothetical protein [Candidatus Manganitrophaceae bacterium]
MRGRKKWPFIFSLLAVMAGYLLFFTQPRPLSFPFSSSIQRRADYRPPQEGASLYPTEGPFGVGVIQTIAAGAGETLFVGTYGEGLFRSDDGGRRWAPANEGLRDKFIVNLAKGAEGTLFAGTIRAGLFKSLDEGRHWTSINRGLENTDVQSMATLPGGRLYAGTGQGVFISRDEGGRWDPFNEGLENALVRSLVAAKDETLYAATQGKGIYKRRPGAGRWTEVVGGFDYEGIEERVIRVLALGRDGALYAGTLGAGIFRSGDGGIHWKGANAGLPNLSIRSLAADPDGVLYAGTGAGVFYSREEGARWLPLEGGLDNGEVHSFVVSEKGDLYVGTGAGIFKGRLERSWESLHQGLRIAPIRTLTLSGTGDYGAEGVTAGTDGKGVFISKQESWVSDNVGLVNLSVRAMARGKTFLYIATADGLFRRQHGRRQWDPIRPGPPVQAASLGAAGDDHLYVGGPEGLYISSNQGQEWKKEERLGSDPVIALAVREGRVVVAAPNALWVQSEGGWKRVISKEGSPFRFVSWGEGERFFAATGEKIWEGDLNGKWEALKGNLPAGAKITSLAADPNDRDLLYAGSDRGLFWSGDGGANWRLARLYQGERFEKQVNQIVPTPIGIIWVATEEDGVMFAVDKIPRRNRLQRWFEGVVHR